jgi:hypothetical protein
MHADRTHRHQEDRVSKLLREYRFEVVWLAIVLLGLFLVLEQIEISPALLQWLTSTDQAVQEDMSLLDGAMQQAVAPTAEADAIGYALILGAAVAILLRIRWRLMRAPSLTSIRCPRCRADLHRVHRRTLDHAIDWYVPVRRYRCANRQCNWDGLRIARSTHRRRSAPSPHHASTE